MTTTQIPEWAKQFDVVTSEEEETTQGNAEFEALLNETGSGQSFQEGEVYKGKVVSITDDLVTVDIGYKQEGLVFAKEFRNYDGTLKVSEGDEIEVYLERLESHLGNLVLSKDKAEILKAWDKISEACEKGDPVKGTVIAKVKAVYPLISELKRSFQDLKSISDLLRTLISSLAKQWNLRLSSSTRKEGTSFFLEELSFKRKEAS